VIGWALDNHLEARLAIEALDMALNARDPNPTASSTTPIAASNMPRRLISSA
jgi:hypothetical protein